MWPRADRGASIEHAIQHTGVVMKQLLTRFFRDESGATAIEYGLIAAGISVTIIAAVTAVGTDLNATFTNIDSAMATAGK